MSYASVGLILFDERHEIFDPRLHVVELPLADLGAIDDDDQARHFHAHDVARHGENQGSI
jgi:hypothetical protein